MAHFARVENGIVRRVHVVSNDVITDSDGVEYEAWGQDLLATLHGHAPTDYLQCSYNANFRGQYPAPGYTYDEERDAFIPPKPFDSWVLNEETCLWEAPIPYPNDGLVYSWDEESGDWIEVVEPSA